MEQIGENIWLLRFPLSLLGTRIGRNVTVIRLTSGELVIHSTAPFAAADIEAIATIGRPAWLVDATLFHDTFAKAGRAAFPDLLYYMPDGFPAVLDGRTRSLGDPPAEWAGELEVLPLDGIPRVREHVFFHSSSRTLIVADLLFNIGTEATAWTRFFFRWLAGLKHGRGMSHMFRMMIRDRAAFTASVRQMMQWDFERIVVAHGEIVKSNAKAVLREVLAGHGYLTD